MNEKRKKSTVRHTRAIQRDRTKRPNSAPPDEKIEARLTEIIHPAPLNQVAYFHDLGWRERILNLPIMMAFVLALIWRQLGSVSEAVRVLKPEGVVWVDALHVSQQAVEQRLGSLSAILFERVLAEILPLLVQRHHSRTRPLPPALAWAQRHFSAVLALDGSTLDSLLRKCGVLRDSEAPVLAGRMAALLDGVSHLPRQIWYEEDPYAHDQRFWDRALAALQAGMLLIFDLGFLNFDRFDQLTDRGVFFVTRMQAHIAYRVDQIVQANQHRRDLLVWVGSSASSQCRHRLRLVAWQHNGKWYRSLTNVLDPRKLPAAYVVALYWQRWRIEDAFNIVKRLLGLA